MTHLTETLLNEYLDEVLDETSRHDAEIHLADCIECADRLEALQHAFVTLELLDEKPLEHDLTLEILAGISIQKRSIPFVWRLVLAAQAGFGLGILLALGRPFLTNLPEPRIILDRILALWLFIPTLVNFRFQFPIFTLSTFNLPLKAENFIAVVLAITLLWVVGNATLLRPRPEARK